jgi:diguanylate cyclase (GGDEF)-like protein
LLPLTGFAAIENVRFQRFFVEQGLSQQGITAIFQDSRGFMWFGTQEGLNLYDGRRFVVFTQSFDDPDAIISSWVTSITEDADGFIWIGTRGGVSRYNPVTNTFSNFRANGNSGDINDQIVRRVLRDHNNTIWVATREGINKYLPEQNIFESLQINGADGKGADIFDMVEGDDGNLWLASDRDGVFHYSSITGTITQVFGAFGIDDTLEEGNIRALLINNAQQLIIGTAELGLFSLDLKEIRIGQNADQAFVYPKHLKVTRDIVTRDLYQDREGTLWVAGEDGLYYQKQDGSFGHFQHQSDNQFSLSDNKILSLYQDASDVMWVGSFKGLNKWNTATTQFDHFRVSSLANGSLSGNNITAIASLDDTHAIIANMDGVDVVDLNTGRISAFNLPPVDGNEGEKYRIMSLATVANEIWLGTAGEGVLVYNRDDKSLFRYVTSARAELGGDNLAGGLHASGITAIYPEDENTVWVTTYGGGLSKINRQSNEVLTYRKIDGDENSLSSDRVMTITQAHDGRLWLGTWDGGISIFNPKTELAYRIKVEQDNKTGLSANLVWTILEDKDKNIWVGTQGGGVHLLRFEDLDHANIQFTRLTKSDGMPSNVVFGILQDEHDNIWASSNKGLTRIHPETLDLINFNYALGLQSDEFNSGSFAEMDDGKMLFGGPNGVSAFYPDEVTLNFIRPKTAITAFQRLDIVSSIDSQKNTEQEIIVAHTDYLIGFEFASLHFTAPEKNKYKYRLNGFDSDWVEAGEFPRAVYTNLPAGAYVFEVISANSDGVWNMRPAQAKIQVKPAPWASWYAYSLYVLMALLSCFMLYRWYHNKLQAETTFRQSLEREVQQRTQELSELNKKLLTASITDQLTGLFNRRYMADIIERKSKRVYKQFMKAHARKEVDSSNGPRLVFVMFDLDGFKPINDNYGHDAGDKIIQEVAKLLRNACRIDDVTIRWGGDEFLLIGEVNHVDEVTQLVEKIRSKIERKGFDIGLAQRMHLSSSIGFAMYPFSHHSPDSLTWKQTHILADVALYKSKEAGKNAWTGLLQSESSPSFTVMNTLMANIEKAIENRDVRLIQSVK